MTIRHSKVVRGVVLGLMPVVPLIAILLVFIATDREVGNQGRRSPPPPSGASFLQLESAKTRPIEATAAPKRVPAASADVTFLGDFAEDTVGSKGVLWTASDELGSSIVPGCRRGELCYTVESREICVSGVTAAVGEREYAAVWGAALGWNLFEESAQRTPRTTPISPVGVRFTVSLNPSHVALLRLSVTTDAGEYCADLVPGQNRVLWRDLKHECWSSGGAAWTERKAFPALKWQIVSQRDQPQPFSFCIQDLATLSR